MGLKKEFIFWSTLLLSLVLALGSFSVWNLASFWRATAATNVESSALGRAEAVMVQVGWLRDALRSADASTYRGAEFFTQIQTDVKQIAGELRRAARTDDGDGAAEEELGRTATEQLQAAIQQSTGEPINLTTAQSRQVAADLDRLHQTLSAATRLLPASSRHHLAATSERLRWRLVWTCIVLLLVLGVSMVIHVKQFRTLVRPLLWLRDDMSHSAANDYKQEVRLRGEREFKDVARLFNGLARELAELYWSLEKKVIERSRELVRSERLASVGFLAAGVSHEINNPLSIISGYAELAAGNLRAIMLGEHAESDAVPQAQAEAESLARALEAQEIIREEAFRCKEITSRLLSLARGGSDGRQPMCLGEVARQVSVLTKGLKNYRDRKVVLDFNHTSPLEIVANPTEMKQVLLNLTVNALEAVPSGRGEVRIGGRRTGEWVELSVEDNGKGMTAETLEHVFEPFFTAKRGGSEPGTGLGLSVTHAIIENHGGRIRVESHGPGRGSRFTVRLPAMAGT